MSLETLEAQVKHFETLDNSARIQALIGLAQTVSRLGPTPDNTWDFSEVRQDEECLDSLGVFLKKDHHVLHFAATVGEETTTLTRALTSVLVQHLSGETPERILSLSNQFVPRLVGEQLLRQRRNTAYYPLRRIQEAVKNFSTSIASVG
jgi:cysteine desulfuration protein SufE